jgi:type II secretory pathway component PulK
MTRWPSHRRGAVLIVALWVTIALTGMVLTFAFSMRTEAMAAANRIAQAQAEAAEHGAEQWLLCVVDQESVSPGTIAETNIEARQIGQCFVWVVRPDCNESGVLAYGLDDEAGKVDLNTASRDMPLNLPAMTEDVADSIIDWRDVDSSTSAQGAEDDYYMSLPEAYHCKNGNFESVDELLLVKGITSDLLYGYDRNRNGIIDGNEAVSGNPGTMFNANNDTGVGFAPYVSGYGVQVTSVAAVAARSTAPININDKRSGNMAQLRSRLSSAGIASLDTIVQNTTAAPEANNLFHYYWLARLNVDDFTRIFSQTTAGQFVPATGPPPATRPAAPALAKVNINTAPEQVLMCLPGLTQSDAQAIISQRQSTTVTSDPTNIAWIAPLLDTAKAASMGGLITGQSTVYSGDIVAISPDGRAFRRTRVVISAASGSARIIYRRDMTPAGWPLPTEIREAIRSGEGYQSPVSGGTLK